MLLQIITPAAPGMMLCPPGDIEFACNHWSVFENAIDMAHIHYLHSDSFGNEEAPQIRDMTCSHDAFGVKASFKLHNKPVNKLWEFSQVGSAVMLHPSQAQGQACSQAA